MHLSRHRMTIIIAEHTLRPGDGERWVAGWVPFGLRHLKRLGFVDIAEHGTVDEGPYR